MAQFILVRQGHFGLVKKQGFFSGAFYDMLAEARNPNSVAREDIVSGTFHMDSVDRYSGLTKHAVMYANYAAAAYAVLKCHVPNFPVDPPLPSGTPDEPNTFLGYHLEDWNRAVSLVRWFTSSQNELRLNKGIKAASLNRTLASLPYYLTEEDTSGTIEEDDDVNDDEEIDDEDPPEVRTRKERTRWQNSVRTLEEQLEGIDKELIGFDYNIVEDVQRIDPSSLTSAEYNRHYLALENVLTKIFQPSSHTRAVNDEKLSRPKCTNKEVERFCADMAKQVKVKWGFEDIDNMRKTPSVYEQHLKALTPVIADYGKTHSALSQADVEVGSKAHKTTEDKEDEEDEDDEAATPDQMNEWNMRRLMSTQAAPLPSYLESCTWCNIPPDNLVIEQAPPDNNGEPLKYKEHQVISEY